MDYKGLEKTFNIKIPIYKHADYYIDTLKKSAQFKDIDSHIEMFKEYEEYVVANDRTVKYDKVKNITDILSMFHNTGLVQKLTEWTLPIKSTFKKKGFDPENGKLYLSVDVNEANWTVMKHYLGLDYPKWEEYILPHTHPTLAKSKTFRQYVLGNTSPKKFASMQRDITSKHLYMLPLHTANSVVMVSEDEIIFEIEKITEVERILSLEWLVPVKGKIFKTNFHTNYNEHVRLDTVYDNSGTKLYKELKAVNGNRFFLHFKSLVLEEEIDDRDLLFLNDKHEAKWVIQ